MFIRVMDVPKPRVRVGALALIAGCCLRAPAYYSSLQHLRTPFHKALTYLQDTNVELRSSAFVTLRVFHNAARTCFEQQAALLPLPTFDALKYIMRDSLICDAGVVTSKSRLRPGTLASPSQLALNAGMLEVSRPTTAMHRPLVQPWASTQANDVEASRHTYEVKEADWDVLLRSLLHQLVGPTSGNNQRDALLGIKRMSLYTDPDADLWNVHFEHVLDAVLRLLEHQDSKLRELTIDCCKDLLRALPKRFRAFTEHVLLRLLAAARDQFLAVASGAEEALELLFQASDVHRCLGVLLRVVMCEGPPMQHMAIRFLSKLSSCFTALQLLSILHQLLPTLFEAFKSPSADVRKAVVFCLVDVYMILGEQLTPHLAGLSTSQIKLVTIYIDRVRRV